jgi:hypothetical protein
MKTCFNYLAHPILVVTCALLMMARPVPFASAQSGGGYSIHPATIPGGGGASTNVSTRVEGSIGQIVLGTSTAAPFEINSGFWPNAVPCPFAVSPRAQFFTVSGGAGSVNVIATESCNWTATASAGWINITSKDSGTGNGVVTFEARENFTGSARAASITISGLTQIQVQDGGLGDDCDYSISPAFQSFSSTGGTGSVQVLTPERCAWQAVATVGWITITSSQVGIGNGTVIFAVAPNTGSGRAGSIVIAGKAFAVKQKGS